MFPPTFTSQRLRLAAPTEADQADFALWSRDDAYLRMLDDEPVRPQAPASKAYARARARFGHLVQSGRQP